MLMSLLVNLEIFYSKQLINHWEWQLTGEECGQVPSGAGRTHFMMQYYAYILMFVIFDVMAIFLYAWGSTILNMPRTATLPIIAFLAIMFAAMAFALYQSKRRNIW